MISIHLRSDIKPYCDRHPARQMSLVFMQLDPGPDKPWQPTYVCGEPHCPRHYNPNFGYFNIFKRRVDYDTVQRVPCPHDSLPMFVESIDTEHHLWTWRCSQYACDGMSLQAATQSKSAKA
jgi:hypothetical protein